MRGPSIALSNGAEDLGNRKGNAALHGLSTTNIQSIGYVAVLVSLSLSSIVWLTNAPFLGALYFIVAVSFDDWWNTWQVGLRAILPQNC